MTGPFQIEQTNQSRRDAGTSAAVLKRLKRLETNRRLTEDWHIVGAAGEPAFASGWSAYGSGFSPVRFAIDALKVVRLEGLLTKGAGNWNANETMFTLPVGYRPDIAHVFIGAASSSGQYELRVMTDGIVKVGDYGGPANPATFASISGVTFRVA